MSDLYPEYSASSFVLGTYDTPVCQWCGTGIYHLGVCPKVKAIEYNQYGQMMRVEFHKPGTEIGGYTTMTVEVTDDE